MNKRSNILTEFIDFIKERKSYYLIPIILVLLLLLGLVALSLLTGGAAAPFIYTLF